MRVAIGLTPTIDLIRPLEYLTADRTALPELFPVMVLAVNLAFFLEILPLTDQLTAGRAAHAEQLIVVVFAVRLTIPLIETLPLEGPTAAHANEVLRVPGAIQSSRVRSRDRLTAVRATRTESLMKAGGVIRPTIPLMKLRLPDRFTTATAVEAFRVPFVTEGSQIVTAYGSLAAMAFCHGKNPSSTVNWHQSVQA